MIKLVYCIVRNAKLTREEFHDYWLNSHGALVKSVAESLGAIRYVQSHTIESNITGYLMAARGTPVQPFDGITEFWWHDEASMKSPNGVSPETIKVVQQRLLIDEAEFIDFEASPIFITQEHEIYSL